jgi:predicted amidophosphoribosyltransferase
VPIDGTNTKIVNANKDLAIKWFASWAAAKIIALGVQPKVLIPIPSSKTIVASPEEFRTFKIAQEIAARVPKATATSLLRFVEPSPSSREEGGSRDPEVLYQNMTLTGAIPSGQIILIDDIMTSGGHFIAASWKLEDQGRTPKLALACGRTMDARIDDPFVVAPEDVDIAR